MEIVKIAEEFIEEKVRKQEGDKKNWLVIFSAPEGGVASSVCEEYGSHAEAYSFDVPDALAQLLTDLAGNASFDFYIDLT